jgi:hypothetical protein
MRSSYSGGQARIPQWACLSLISYLSMLSKENLILDQFLNIYTNRHLCYVFVEVRTIQSRGNNQVFWTIFEMLDSEKSVIFFVLLCCTMWPQ